MDKKVENMINEAVINIINKCSSSSKINRLKSKHEVKVHFIPKKYRIFGGLLQSMNIQFGNFIEELMAVLIKNESKYEIISEYSGKKSNNFKLSSSNGARIDNFITKCQTENINIDKEFPNLLNEIVRDIINDNQSKTEHFKHDIDLLFKDKNTNKIYYLEIKYNDDHDTGKFVDINRKFIKTYAYLAKELNIKKSNDLVPILFFFNNKRMKGNIYVPEETNIKRGQKFFDEFLSVKYSDVDSYMATLSESKAVKKMFDDLYNKIMEKIEFTHSFNGFIN